jgi:hypothetical protein
VILLRLVAYALPQVLLLLLLGAWLDLLGGWNHTDAGFSTFLLVCGLAPVAVIVLLAVEVGRSILSLRRRDGRASFLMPGLALLLAGETFLILVFILSQARM